MRFKEFLSEESNAKKTKGRKGVSLTETKELPVKQEWLDKAKKAIEQDENFIYDVAANLGQQLDNIKHMKWFIREVALQMAEDRKQNPFEKIKEAIDSRIVGGMSKTIMEDAKKYAIYYDYTGAGRGPEIIAGPFDSEKEANDYAKEHGWPLRGDNYFVDVYHESMNEGVEHTPLLKKASKAAANDILQDTLDFLLKRYWNDPKSDVKKRFKSFSDFVSDKKEGLPYHMGAAYTEFCSMTHKNLLKLVEEEIDSRGPEFK